MANLTRKELDKLRVAIRSMDRQHALYKLLKEELEALGRWKPKPRGNSTGIENYKIRRVDT